MAETIIHIKPTTFKPKDKDVYGQADGYTIVTDKQIINIGMTMDTSCCESPGYFMSEDNLDEFIGAQLVSVDIVDQYLKPEQMVKIYDGGVMFVNFTTDRGVLQFVAYNMQNGYYGHYAVIESEQLTHLEII